MAFYTNQKVAERTGLGHKAQASSAPNYLGRLSQSAALCSARNVGGLPPSKGEIVQIHVGHEPEQRQPLARAASRWFFA
jgi:hypothetical protein